MNLETSELSITYLKCECGKRIREYNIPRHLKSKYHNSNLKQQSRTKLNRALADYSKDQERIGSYSYQGIANFWHPDLNYLLENATPEIRKQVHLLFLERNIPLRGNHDTYHILTFGIVRGFPLEEEL